MNEKPETRGNASFFLAGIMVGGIAGAVTMLLIAPQSGQKTRNQIQAKGVELRDDAVEAIETVTAQARRKGQKITADIREKADELQQRGQQFYNDQRENLAAIVAGDHHEIDVS